MKGGVYKCIVCVKLDSGGGGGTVSGSLYMCKLFFECVACVCVCCWLCIIKKCSPFVTIMLSSNTNSCIKYDYILLQLLRIFKLTSAIRVFFPFFVAKNHPLPPCHVASIWRGCSLWQSDS